MNSIVKTILWGIASVGAAILGGIANSKVLDEISSNLKKK